MWKILLIITFISCSQNNRLTENINLNGTWEAEGVYTITFNPNAKFKISFDEEKSNNVFKGVYLVKDFNHIKILDLKKIEKFNGSLFGIFKFLDLNTIKISKFSNYIKTRPVSFEKNNYYILKRKN
tara:strand:- start:592 stop:969 length:378 start_codon:yes stop_codon:yes gene_type:complete